MSFTINRKGTTRIVILTKNYAIKIPNFYFYRLLLRGILGNLQERKFSTLKSEELCPTIFSSFGGLINIQPRCKEINRQEFTLYESKINKICSIYPVEKKINSFGWYEDKLVAFDYGS